MQHRHGNVKQVHVPTTLDLFMLYEVCFSSYLHNGHCMYIYMANRTASDS